MQCLLNTGHEGRHQYTPKGLLSPSTITKILLGLTSGEIRSRAGLDNTDVLKGRNNFEKMRSLNQILNSFTANPTAKVDSLNSRIDAMETFHKVGFEEHLRSEKLASGKIHACMCLHCGFYEDRDKIKCPAKGKHKPPCKQCQDSFEVLHELFDLHDEVKKKLEGNASYSDSPSLQDDIMTWKDELNECVSNLVDYRAHSAHKVSEANFDREYYSNLPDDEAVLICDYKMKVLASRYREAQVDWYAKRGTTILGFELHFTDKNKERKVLYFLFVSDDTYQDSLAVLCAKHFMYTEVLPLFGIKKCHFRADGALCFSSKDAKASMKVWDFLAGNGGCHEKSYKISVAGCGKTALDGKKSLLFITSFTYNHSTNSFQFTN